MNCRTLHVITTLDTRYRDKGLQNAVLDELMLIAAEQIVKKLEHLVDSIELQGKRTADDWEKAKETDKKHKEQLLLILGKIKLLWYDQTLPPYLRYLPGAKNHLDGIKTRQ